MQNTINTKCTMIVSTHGTINQIGKFAGYAALRNNLVPHTALGAVKHHERDASEHVTAARDCFSSHGV